MGLGAPIDCPIGLFIIGWLKPFPNDALVDILDGIIAGWLLRGLIPPPIELFPIPIEFIPILPFPILPIEFPIFPIFEPLIELMLPKDDEPIILPAVILPDILPVPNVPNPAPLFVDVIFDRFFVMSVEVRSFFCGFCSGLVCLNS